MAKDVVNAPRNSNIAFRDHCASAMLREKKSEKEQKRGHEPENEHEYFLNLGPFLVPLSIPCCNTIYNQEGLTILRTTRIFLVLRKESGKIAPIQSRKHIFP